MKLEVIAALIALDAKDADKICDSICNHFGFKITCPKTVLLNTSVRPRASIIVMPEIYTSYAFGELWGATYPTWGFSWWNFNIKDSNTDSYLMFI